MHLRRVWQNQKLASSITMAAAITHLAKLVTGLPLSWTDSSKAVQVLVLSMRILTSCLHDLPPRGYANCLWALSKIYSADRTSSLQASSSTKAAQLSSTPDVWRRGKGRESQVSEMSLPALAFKYASELTDALVQNNMVETFNAQDLANTCYGLAVLGLDHHPAWNRELLPRAARLATTFMPHGLSNVLWALGKIGKVPEDPTVLPALLQQARALMDKEAIMQAEGPARGLRERTTANHEGQAGAQPSDVHTVHGTTDQSAGRRHDVHTVHGTTDQSAGWPSGAMGFRDRGPSSQDRRIPTPKLSETLSPQFFSNIAWALARMRHMDMPFFSSVERMPTALLQDSNSQNLSNLLWAFAVFDLCKSPLFTDLAPFIIRQISRGNAAPQALSNTVWAYAKTGNYIPAVFDSVSAASQSVIYSFNSQDLANLAWAYGVTAHRDRPLFTSIVKVAPLLIPLMAPVELSQLTWSMATLNFTSERLCSLITDMVVSKLQLVERGGNRRGFPQYLSKSYQGDSLVDDGDDSASMLDQSVGMSRSLQTPAGTHASIPLTMNAMAQLAWAYAVMRPGDTKLFSAVFVAADNLAKLRGEGEQLKRCDAGQRPHGGKEKQLDMDYHFEGEAIDLRALRQLYQGHMAHQLACLKGHAVPPGHVPAEMSQATLSLCRDAWRGLVENVTTSSAQREVLESLDRMGYRCLSEHVIANGLFCVDILFRHESGRDIVVEVDGPYHFASNDRQSPLGELLLRNRLIRALGYVLVCVPTFEWRLLAKDTLSQRAQFLKSRIDAAIRTSSVFEDSL
ncbi:hypothetical protein CEUSTIGMA_g10834.t1 [Chlamydomonas eustigma]|uniref:RAP domain-containing protein n=1 Tax=Chlamydomonas eustigma TaxID=1157962 RepID=A0A250XKF1_9CHLO|nr:hypothetical protein CEUSTIGMA_g10834.t1 [Chlamydomonas eustigma]|eukprot:GAX83409.1 hypothetical protein CEUSTIGMA_g10834.t1 [Chlamydomonas eustigma]